VRFSIPKWPKSPRPSDKTLDLVFRNDQRLPVHLMIGSFSSLEMIDLNWFCSESLNEHCVIHAEKNGDLIYSIEDNVYHRKQLGEETCLYNSRDLRAVTGIDLDIEGNIYICGRKSHNIHVLKKSNGLAEIVMKKEHGRLACTVNVCRYFPLQSITIISFL
jgi:hypothetical protein